MWTLLMKRTWLCAPVILASCLGSKGSPITAADHGQEVASREGGLGTDASSDSPSSDVSSETGWIDVDAATCFIDASKYAGPCLTDSDCVAEFELDSGVFVPVTPSGPREIFVQSGNF